MKLTKSIIDNPFHILYVLLRVLVRGFVGRNTRNRIFTQIGWGRIDGFMKSFNVPLHMIRSLLIKQIHRRVSNRPFQHEPYVSNYLKSKTGNVFIDIGANFGYYSFLLHENFQRIIAIEPHPQNVDVLQCVKQKYGYDRVEVLNIAVSNADGKTKLYIGAHSGGHSLRRNGRFIEKNNFIAVQAKTLASVIGDKIVDLIKVDVEGAEWLVLEGAKRVLNQIDSWLIELHDLSRNKELERWFETRNYTCKWIDEKHIYAERA